MASIGAWALLWLIAAPVGLWVGAASRYALSQQLGVRNAPLLTAAALLLWFGLALFGTWLAWNDPSAWNRSVGVLTALAAFGAPYAAATATRSRLLLLVAVLTGIVLAALLLQMQASLVTARSAA